MDSGQKYSVFYSGELIPEFDLKRCVIKLHSDLGLSKDEIKRILSGGKKKIKSNVDLDIATEITRKFTFCGLYCFYKPAKAVTSSDSEKTPAEKAPVEKIATPDKAALKPQADVRAKSGFPSIVRLVSEHLKKNRQRWESYSTKKKIGLSALCILVALVFYVITGGDSREIQLVKSGTFNNCPGKTVEQAVNGMFGSPKWSSGTGIDGPTKGLTLVNLRGQVSLLNKPVDAVLQFIVDEKNGSFRAHALETNGAPQPYIIMNSLIEAMCEK